MLYDNQPNKCSRIAMSATFRKLDQDVITKIYEQAPDKIIWLKLSWQGIIFNVIISGNPSSSISNSVTQDYKHPTDFKTIVYTNSKQQAQGTLTDSMQAIIANSTNTREVIPKTGNNGLQFKVFTMHAFASDVEAEDYCDTLPNLRIMPATKAADYGMSSHLCRQSYCNGLPPSIYALVQEMGRVDWNSLSDPGKNRHKMHLLFGCLVKMYAGIMQHPDPSKRAIQLSSMREVLALLITPNKCQHNLMERYFENPPST
jgi:hypothetical protein